MKWPLTSSPPDLGGSRYSRCLPHALLAHSPFSAWAGCAPGCSHCANGQRPTANGQRRIHMLLRIHIGQRYGWLSTTYARRVSGLGPQSHLAPRTSRLATRRSHAVFPSCAYTHTHTVKLLPDAVTPQALSLRTPPSTSTTPPGSRLQTPRSSFFPVPVPARVCVVSVAVPALDALTDTAISCTGGRVTRPRANVVANVVANCESER